MSANTINHHMFYRRKNKLKIQNKLVKNLIKIIKNTKIAYENNSKDPKNAQDEAHAWKVNY